MKPIARRRIYVQPLQPASAVLAEMITAMPIVLLVGAVYEAFVEPVLRAGLLLPSRQG